MKKAGVIGSGQVGQVLANGLLKHGYSVMIGSRDAGKLEDWKKSGGVNAHTGSVEEAAAFGSLIILAVKGEAALDAIALAGSAVNGKTVIDTTNPIDHTRPPVNGVLPLFTGPNESLMERIQKAAPGAHVVKCFSCVGNAFMVEPKFPKGKPTMFICGNNEEAKNEVKGLLETFGWNYEDMGKVEGARAIEPLVSLWCIPGILRNEWTHAFALFKM